MLSNLASIIAKTLASSNVNATTNFENVNVNPFGQKTVNPFISSSSFGSNSSNGKNQPVAGGYFAGYYNGKPNIVGRILFIEV